MPDKYHPNQPELSDGHRSEAMKIAEPILTTLIMAHGFQMAMSVMRVLWTSLYASAFWSGAPGNQVLAEFDFMAADCRRFLQMVIAGDLKPGDMGPR